ncbi:MAG: HD domain-containing protein [Candidatus Lokiarchaeota archaeon]|nr:HD domain-containing protein [Candidatus Lokiarchaeota archaeon]
MKNRIIEKEITKMVFSRQLTSKEIEILIRFQEFVKHAHAESDSHDYSHVLTVTRNAIKIAKKIDEPVDPFICIASALLHDIGKSKPVFSHIHGLLGGAIAEEFLEGCNVPAKMRDKICRAVIRHTPTSMIPPETTVEKVIFDADCLDRLGLMGLIRGFVGKTGSMEEILSTYLVKREKDYATLHFEISKELGEWKQQELEGFIPFIQKRLEDRMSSIKDIFKKENLLGNDAKNNDN